MAELNELAQDLDADPDIPDSFLEVVLLAHSTERGDPSGVLSQRNGIGHDPPVARAVAVRLVQAYLTRPPIAGGQSVLCRRDQALQLDDVQGATGDVPTALAGGQESAGGSNRRPILEVR